MPGGLAAVMGAFPPFADSRIAQRATQPRYRTGWGGKWRRDPNARRCGRMAQQSDSVEYCDHLLIKYPRIWKQVHSTRAGPEAIIAEALTHVEFLEPERTIPLHFGAPARNRLAIENRALIAQRPLRSGAAALSFLIESSLASLTLLDHPDLQGR
jgi:hypothetical protein